MRFNLNPKKIGWTPYVYLVYLVFLFIQPILSTDYGLQNYDASFGILSSTISKNGKLVIQLWGKAKLYNLDGNHIEINGELSLLVLSCFGLIY